jgi:DNA-binding XRE family transcriptional regulator
MPARVEIRPQAYEEAQQLDEPIYSRVMAIVVIPEEDYDRFLDLAAAVGDAELSGLPDLLPSGNYPAVEALRVGLARKLVKRRWAAGLTQVQVARRAGIRPETLNRIEKAKVTADTATVAKIMRVLEGAHRNQGAARD